MPEPSAGLNVVSVVCGIIERGDLFLAALRGPAQSNANLWEFPGGKVCSSETAEAALQRELREELGIEVSVTTPLPSHTFTYPWITIELTPFICTLVHGEPRPREHAEIRWVTLQEAQVLQWAPADVAVVREYLILKT